MSLDLICLKGVGESLDSCSSMPTWATNWPKLWSGTLTIKEEHLVQNPTIGSSNPILNGSTSQVLKVKAARVGLIRDVATTMTPKARSTAKAPRKGWISATAMLRKRHLALADASTDSIKTCHGIWKTLTMNQLPPDFNESVGMACFEPMAA
jgi:hypothetical protein